MHALVLFFAVSLVSTATPGPAVLYVSSQGVGGGLRSAIPASLGILAADAFYILLSITGLTSVLVTSYQLFTTLRWAGAIYLTYLGVRLLIAGLNAAPHGDAPRSTASNPLRAMAGGFTLHAANPKALLYFGSLVPQFVDPTRSWAAQLMSLAMVHLMTAAGVLLLYSLLSARFRQSSPGRRARRAFHVASGTFLVGAGVSLAFSHRTGR